MELEAKNTLLDVMTAEYSLILGQVDLKDLYNLSLASRAYHSVMQTAFKDVVGHICREKGYLMKPYYFDCMLSLLSIHRQCLTPPDPYLVHCYQKCSKMAKNFDPDLTGRFLFTSPEMVSSALSENYLVATYSTPKTSLSSVYFISVLTLPYFQLDCLLFTDQKKHESGSNYQTSVGRYSVRTRYVSSWR